MFKTYDTQVWTTTANDNVVTFNIDEFFKASDTLVYFRNWQNEFDFQADYYDARKYILHSVEGGLKKKKHYKKSPWWINLSIDWTQVYSLVD